VQPTKAARTRLSASLISALPPSTLAGPPDGMIAANVPASARKTRAACCRPVMVTWKPSLMPDPFAAESPQAGRRPPLAGRAGPRIDNDLGQACPVRRLPGTRTGMHTHG